MCGSTGFRWFFEELDSDSVLSAELRRSFAEKNLRSPWGLGKVVTDPISGQPICRLTTSASTQAIDPKTYLSGVVCLTSRAGRRTMLGQIHETQRTLCLCHGSHHRYDAIRTYHHKRRRLK